MHAIHAIQAHMPLVADCPTRPLSAPSASRAPSACHILRLHAPPNPLYPDSLPRLLPPARRYVSAASWSIMVITGTGGTDNYPLASSIPETAFVTVLVFLGALLWTQVLALFCDVATNSNPAETLFRQTIDVRWRRRAEAHRHKARACARLIAAASCSQRA